MFGGKMRPFSFVTAWGVLLAVAGPIPSAPAEIIHESAMLGPTGISSGANLYQAQFLGARFHIDRRVDVTAVGGHLTMHLGFEGQTLFAAIVPLEGPDALPLGEPFGEGEVIASAVFSAGFPSSDVRVPLSVTLDPGYYGLIFGTGLFGATGEGGMPLNNYDLPGASYLFWNGFVWFGDPFDGARFVVEGDVVVADTDGDGVDDAFDVCCDTPTDVAVDGEGRPLGDLDTDCDVDLVDFAIFENLLTEGNEVVLSFLAMFQNNFTGELPEDGPCW